VILFTDDDCEVPEDWVGRHVEAIAAGATGSLGAVAGMSRTDEIYDPATLPASHRSGSPPWLIGHSANMAVRTSALRAVNGFDERLGPGTSGIGGDDADLIVRLLRAGSVLRAGSGGTVRHMDWRSSEANRENLIAYEHGAGRWIGKTFREQPRAGLSFLGERIELIRYRSEVGKRNISGRELAAALGRGFASGVLMKPWRGRRDG
jgi:GT2 family glycosyltransferase